MAQEKKNKNDADIKPVVKLIADQPMIKTIDDTHLASNIESNIRESKKPVAIGSTRG